MYIFLLLWFILIIYKIKYQKPQEQSMKEGLSYKHTLPVRGILAIEIMFGHFYGFLNNGMPVWINDKIGVLIVGFFLFLSGWGLWEGKTKKDNYFHNFLKKHFFKIVLPLYLSYIVYILMSMTYSDFSKYDIFNMILGEKLINFINWYVWELLILYFIFYILYKSFTKNLANIILLVMSIMLILLGSYFEIGSRWYGSTLCFFWGIVCSQYQNKIFKLLCINYFRKICILTIALFGSIVAFTIVEGMNCFLEGIAVSISTLLFSVITFALLTTFRTGNSITIFLGTISYEIFIIHSSMMEYVRGSMDIQNDGIYALIVIVLTVSVSWMTNKIAKAILKKVN